MNKGPTAKRFCLVWTHTFLRTAQKFIRRHPDLRSLLERVLKQIEENPHAPHLKLHALKGRHKGEHAVSLTHEYRIVFILKIVEGEVVLLDIGSHDEVYK